MYDINELKGKKLPELKEIAEALTVPKYKSLNKQDLVYRILDHQAANPDVAKAAQAETAPKKDAAKAEKPAGEQKTNRSGKQRSTASGQNKKA